VPRLKPAEARAVGAQAERQGQAERQEPAVPQRTLAVPRADGQAQAERLALAAELRMPAHPRAGGRAPADCLAPAELALAGVALAESALVELAPAGTQAAASFP